MRVLVVDVGGTHVKLLVTGETEPRKFDSGDEFTPDRLVEGIRGHTQGWIYDVAAIGIPSPVLRGAVMVEPWNLGRGWVGFDFEAALGVPTRIINDAAMQALGSDEGGRMLFLGLGSGLGTALVDEGHVVGLELAHLPYRDKTFEDYCGQNGLQALGEAAWKDVVFDTVERLRAAVAAEYVVLGGGNVRLFDELPPRVRRGNNDRAFEGGFRLWRHEQSIPAEWQPLFAHADTWRVGATVPAASDGIRPQPPAPALSTLFHDSPTRAETFTLRHDAFVVDYSKTHVTSETMRLLIDLARATGVESLRDRMFAGDPINTTEGRAVLHTALRNRSPRPVMVDGRDVMPDVRAALAHAGAFSRAVRGGAWTGHTGARITDVVNIGIGGSDLGPAMATAALEPYAGEGPRLHFVSNVDGAHIGQTLRHLDPRTTLFVIASKTFTTQETMTNARTAREWFLASASDEAHIARHFVAVSTNDAEVRRFGIGPEQMFVFWDWVGGRYSVWSSIGLPVALAVGPEQFDQMLDGAFAMDEHFRTAPIAENIPMVLGLIGVWYASVLGLDTHAVLPYEQLLHRLPAYLQQLDMESNGKRVDRHGRPVSVGTGPIVWGEPGTNGQHAFYQLLHQGTRVVPCDFLVGLESPYPLGDHHRLLLANCFAQTEALMRGKDEASVRADLAGQGLEGEALERLVPHKVFPGNRPSTTIVYRKLDARTLGMLLAMYEHKVFTMGAVWGVNSFDQWGVELGKQLAKRIDADLAAEADTAGHDASTNQLINLARGGLTNLARGGLTNLARGGRD
ncbi:MAG TPA: glucose-6-phosphate isomerase [Vicinamibacterales bacterium]|nr:glucose-6-phosphate isomerase [Vicinamibacterales bacterium]